MVTPPDRLAAGRDGVTVFTRNRVVGAAMVVAFVAVFAAIGAVSRPTPTVAATAVGELVPSAPWYWTMAVSPTDPNVLVLGTSSGLYRSGNGGKTWKPTGPKRVNATSLVQAGDSIFVGGVLAATPSPVARKGDDRVAPDGAAVLTASADGGKTWRKLTPSRLAERLSAGAGGRPGEHCMSSTPCSTPASSTARPMAPGRSSFVSSKLGVPPWAFAITQDGRFVAGDMDSGSYVSTNGKAWKRTAFKDSKGGRMVMEYAVQPSDSTRVLMSEYGLLMSRDSGKTWHVVLKSKTNVMFGPVAWSPSNSDVAYAVGFDRSVWRSDDSGEHWTKVS